MNTFFRRLRYLLQSSRREAELREEIEAHRALRQGAFERDGLEPEDAAHASRRALGNVALAVDDARDVWTIRTVDGVWQDVRAALRGLRKSQGFALVAIGTLALGIGVNTALFSIFSSLILRPLPVRDPGSLALLTNGSWYPCAAAGTSRPATASAALLSPSWTKRSCAGSYRASSRSGSACVWEGMNTRATRSSAWSPMPC